MRLRKEFREEVYQNELGGRCQDSLSFQCVCYCRLNCEGNIERVKWKHRESEGET